MEFMRESQKSDNDTLLQSSTQHQQKSFEGILQAPYNSSFEVGNRARSVESPYTSLGSGRSSYASIRPATYSSLRAKAVKASSQHESKSKAVMRALTNLQEKIGSLEVDRMRAEKNLKSLASETREYKELLIQQHTPTNGRRGFHSEELESQLENAQGRCEILEKQLEYMRKMMQGQPNSAQTTTPTTTYTPNSPRLHTPSSSPVFSGNSSPFRLSPQRNAVPVATNTPREKQIEQQQQQLLKSPTSPRKQQDHQTRLSTVEGSPAIEKLNDLEHKHLRLSASQDQTENKIRELEEKIREESHCRKLLEDKASELEQVVVLNGLNSARTTTTLIPSQTHQKLNHRQPKQRKKKLKKLTKKSSPVARRRTASVPATMVHQRTSKPSKPLSHYHLDLANIPFVVGQSTSRSHSVGANVQNVLSIMKSHSNLCQQQQQQQQAMNGDTFRSNNKTGSSKSRSPISDIDLQECLATLSEEFSQLGEEHRILITRLQSNSETVEVKKKLEKDLETVVKKMETKGKQINTVRDLLKTTSTIPIYNGTTQKLSPRTASNRVVNIGSQEVEVVTTIRPTVTPVRKKSLEHTKSNPKLELLRNVRKLQSTLRRDDLKWV